MKVGTRPPGLHAKVVAEPGIPREEWLETRRTMIGGSDVGSVCGVNKWKSSYALWLDKTGQVPVGTDDAGEAAEWGNLLEPTLLAKVEGTTAYKVLPTPGTLQHPTREWMGVNVDGLAVEPGKRTAIAVVEAKTAGLLNPQGAVDWADDSIPEAYLLQVQHELEVCGLDTAIISAFLAGHGYRQFVVRRDDDLIKLMLAHEERFWEHVVTRTAPPVDGSESTTKLLGRIYEVRPESEARLPRDVYALLAEAREAKAAKKAAEERAAAAENKIKALMGTAEVGMVDDQIAVTWKQFSKGALLDPETLTADELEKAAGLPRKEMIVADKGSALARTERRFADKTETKARMPLHRQQRGKQAK